MIVTQRFPPHGHGRPVVFLRLGVLAPGCQQAGQVVVAPGYPGMSLGEHAESDFQDFTQDRLGRIQLSRFPPGRP